MVTRFKNDSVFGEKGAKNKGATKKMKHWLYLMLGNSKLYFPVMPLP